MSWPRYIQEVLWILAPKLVLLSFLINSPSSSSGLGPFALELLFNGVLQLNQLDGLR